MRKFVALFAAGIVAVLTFSGLGFVGAAATPSETLVLRSERLTETGERALQELRNCLAETPVLNAYYLIDQSGSLYPEFQGFDAEKTRVPILQQSMQQLVSLSEIESAENPITVNFAAGFFGNNFESLTSWVQLTPENLAAQQQSIATFVDRGSLGATNWFAALTAAERELSISPQPGCKLLVWLTDGEIDFGGEENSWQELANLCGKPVDGYQPVRSGGLFEQLRREQVTVVGVYLNPNTPTGRAAWMQSLVEANDASGKKPCGTGEITRGERAGAFINAKSTGDLAFEFIRLGEIISGSADGVIEADGSFSIEAGVTSFRILSQAPLAGLSLVNPRGQTVDLSSSTKQVGEAVQIETDITSTADFGKWQLLGAEGAASSLFLSADLRVSSSPLLVNSAQSSGRIQLTLDVVDARIQSLDDYTFDLTASIRLDGKQVELASFSSAELEGGFVSVDIPDPKNLGLVTFRMKNVRAGEQALADIPRVLDYSIYPSLVEVNDFGLARGRVEPAQGSLQFFGPAAGSGAICFAQNEGVTVVSDPGERTDWAVTGLPSGDNQGCVAIGQAESLAIPIELGSQTAANASGVQLTLPVVARSAESSLALPAVVAVTFSTQVINNPVVYWTIVALLLLLAALIPLLVMYLINKLTTKIEHGDDLVRAVLPVQMSTKNDNIMVRESPNSGYDAKVGEVSKPQEVFKMQSPHKDARSITDGEVGTFRAVVPILPFTPPWFEVVAQDGDVLLTGSTPSRFQESRYKLGRKAVFNGQISRTWVAIVREADLMKAGDDPFDAKLVIFDKRGRGGSDRPKQRLLEVQHEAKLSTRFAQIRTAIAAASPKKHAERANETPPENTFGVDVPPIPGGGNAPGAVPPPPPPSGNKRPRGVSATPNPGAPPSPPGSVPPPPPPPPPPLPKKR